MFIIFATKIMPGTRKIRQIQRAPAYQGHMPRGMRAGTASEVVLFMENTGNSVLDYDC
ncbi:MAG: hypothetical protein U0T82_15875 [Bacteroidales bacterium]